MSMLEEIKIIIENLRSNPRIVTFDEAATKQFVVLPLLLGLGWNTHSIDEIRPEFPIENRKVDYSLHVNGRLFFLEVKKIGEDLERHEIQLLEYSFLRGVEFAILTNGIHWWFYLPMKICDWQARKFATLDLLQQNTDLVVQKFVELLSKDNAGTLRNAEAFYRTKRIADTLPVAWNKLISLADLALLERLSEITKEMCGYGPESDETLFFIKEHADKFIIPVEEKKHRAKRLKQESSLRATSVSVTLSIAKLLDAIATEYLKQSKSPHHPDNVTVYNHSDYHLQLTVKKSPSSQSEFDHLEFIATSKQLVSAFERYCDLHGMQNTYTSSSIFVARLRAEIEQLTNAHWEIVSKSSIAPHFKCLRGERYWKFVKTG
jgi:hypothetical protein